MLVVLHKLRSHEDLFIYLYTGMYTICRKHLATMTKKHRSECYYKKTK